MARPLRIERAGAWYHITARGTERRVIYNGNVTYLVDGAQALAASYRYGPYGNLISSSGALADANVYRFSSKEIHANSGMYYYGYRWYAPSLQR